jgi:hypothetical protein
MVVKFIDNKHDCIDITKLDRDKENIDKINLIIDTYHLSIYFISCQGAIFVSLAKMNKLICKS